MILPVFLLILAVALGKPRRIRRNRNGRNTEKSNVLFIIVDDLGWADVPSHSDNEFTLPVIESEIYGQGVEFTSYYTAPVCTPTRASFMTGKYAWKLGMQDVQTMPPAVDERIPRETPTIAEILRDNLGYATYYVGKWHLGYAKWSDTPIGRGFDYAYGYLQGEGDYYDHTMHLNETYGYDMFDMNAQQADWDQVGVYGTDIYNAKALEYLSYQAEGGINADKPFYMYLSYQTIHEPIQRPPGDAYANECNNPALDVNRNIYCQKMKYLDDSIGNVISYLKNNNLYDNTLIVFTTDNGGMVLYDRDMAHKNAFYMPNSYGCNFPYRAGKATLFEGGIRGIGLLAGSFITQRNLQGTSSPMLLSAVDWFNTILEGAAGVEDTAQFVADQGYNDGKTFDGINVLDYLFDPNTCPSDGCVQPEREFIYPNIDVTNALMPAEVKIEIVKTFRIRKTNVVLRSTETYDDGMYGDMPFDAALWYDTTSTNPTLWKYIRGYQLYYNYYNCVPELVNQGDNFVDNGTWASTTEWLFDLTQNPYEYESQNYLSPYFEGTIPRNAIVALQILRSQISSQLNSGEFLGEQDTQMYVSGLPGCLDGTFSPWLDENGNPIATDCDPGCDFDCAVETLTHTSG